MADAKVTALSAVTTTENSDLLYLVDDPGGTPASKKVTLDDVFDRGTVTADAPVINAAQTWNAGAVTFTGWKLNITDTASAAASKLLDLQVGGTPKTYITKSGLGFFTAGLSVGPNAPITLWSSFKIIQSPTGDSYYLRSSSSKTVEFAVEDDDVASLRRSTNPQTYNVYNTYTNSSNYERLAVKWDTNVATISTESAGAGTDRELALQTGGTTRLNLDTTGSMEVTTGLTVATLPATPSVGMIARVTDANAPSIGSTVAGSGAAAALVWYNGSNWTVIGV